LGIEEHKIPGGVEREGDQEKSEREREGQRKRYKREGGATKREVD
jgi:hypothetical protein